MDSVTVRGTREVMRKFLLGKDIERKHKVICEVKMAYNHLTYQEMVEVNDMKEKEILLEVEIKDCPAYSQEVLDVLNKYSQVEFPWKWTVEESK